MGAWNQLSCVQRSSKDFRPDCRRESTQSLCTLLDFLRLDGGRRSNTSSASLWAVMVFEGGGFDMLVEVRRSVASEN